MDVVQDHCEITVHTVSPVHQRGPVFYASLPHNTEAPKEHGANGGHPRRRLVSILWEYLVAMDSPFGKGRASSSLPIQVVRDPLDKPHLLLGESRGPAISFSEGGGAVWAALCGDESDIGIDVAEAGEFQGDYPVHRVFNAEELGQAVTLAGGDVQEASALLWSVKEAAVKALGCGFHLAEPRDLDVHPAAEDGGEYTFSVSLSKRALERLPLGAGRSLWVRSLPQVKGWLSIAFLDGQRRSCDGRQCRSSSAPQKRNADLWQ
ncbi:MAG: 4'-phosphopantetheinyl transferase superfamily protein [Planctomycetota bacterium]|nr:4'-phosphopantetheinyl transferase superfamily protein [Planctomycetota bacterium]